MTTYSNTGFSVFMNPANDTDVEIQNGTTLDLVVDDSISSLRYTVLPLEPGGVAPEDTFVDIDLDLNEGRINGQAFDDDDGPDSQIYEIEWLAAGNVPRTSTILILEEQGINRPPHGNVDVQHFFQLDGDTLPNFATLNAWRDFVDNSLQSFDVPPGSSPLGPNKDIQLSALGFSSSENDVIIGDSDDNFFDGGAGNDSIEGRAGDDTLIGGNGNDTLRGGGGSDNLEGGNGNDYLNPGNNSDFDFILPGSGRDTVDFSNISNARSYVEVAMFDLTAGVTATINGNTDSGMINKGGANNTTTILNLNNAMTASEGGFGLNGSDHDDEFNITPGATGFLQIGGLAGDDTYNFFAGDGFVRLDYFMSGITNGVDVNLGTGIVSDDGFGDEDTINGVENLPEIRTTMLDDNVIGSDGRDRVILLAGNDTADGGDGFDLLRYDRNQVEAVNVNLKTGVATGTWRGEAFNHQISNFEEIRGSRDGNDTIIGRDAVGEFIEGRGGNDRLVGGGGDDELLGQEGNDTLLGGGGDDVLLGENGNDRLLGGGGSDYFEGGDGNDYINPGTNDDGYDQILAGAGQDTVDFSAVDDMTSVGLEHFDLTAGIEITVNGVTNTGSVNKGVNGSTQIINVANTFTWGLSIFGTDHNDVFNITPTDDENTFSGVTGREGDDTFNFFASDGFVRLNYDQFDVENGVNVNLNTGTVSEDGYGDKDTITGVQNLNELRTTMFDDNVIGSAGNDRIILMAGNDTADGGAGVDLIRYDRGGVDAVNVNLSTGTATGTWRGEAFNHEISNFERVRGSREGDDTIIGNNGVGEQIDGRGGNDSINGRGGNDSLNGEGGRDTLRGEGGNDTLLGGDQSDLLFGGGGADEIWGGLGRDTVNMGDGNDVFFDEDQSDGNGRDNVSGGKGSDTINGGGGDDEFRGNDGTDLIRGGIGNDTLYGGGQNDTLNGGSGADSIWGGLGRDTAFMGDGNDVFNDEAQNDSSGRDVVYGGKGNDTINGGGGDDEFRGNNGADLIRGGVGNDTLYGGGQNDTIAGGSGADRIWGGLGRDTVFMGDGNDVFNDEAQNDANGRDVVYGGGGNDTVNGGGGNDTIFGGNGNDSLRGGVGNDVLDGGAGNDTLRGEAGGDTFVFSTGDDQVIGFGGADVVDLSGVASITNFADLQANHLSGGANAVIDDGLGNTMTLTGVAQGTLDAGDFIF